MVNLEKVTDYVRNNFVIRPTCGKWGVYEILGENKARVVYEGTRENCDNYYKNIMYMKYNSTI